MRKSLRIVAGMAIAAWLLGYHAGSPSGSALAEPPNGEKEEAGTNPYRVRLPAPPLDGGVEWVNTTGPIALADLRGRFVLLDFWTFCCINCMQELPEIKKLEAAFPNELVVIGVHSAKFDQEKDSQNIREAIARYEIEHPVVNDANMTIWRNYGARSWPTLVLIDPAGEVVWAASGERPFETIKEVIDAGLPYYRARGLLKPGPRPPLVGAKLPGDSPLRFPGKLVVDAQGGRLFISDSNHNRIVVTDLGGQLLFVVGSGVPGRDDGDFEKASFHRPQGMALVGELLYVADTENHLLRAVDLKAGRVLTAAGTGEKGNGWPGWRAEGGELPDGREPRFTGRAKTTALASPWAICAHGNDLFIAMAGYHQIWRMSTGVGPNDDSSIGPYAGNGREDIVDGRLLPPMPYELGYASFAQPSGLSTDGERLYVADSEGSTVREVPFDPAGTAQTLVGLTGTLFDFGDTDGVGPAVRLQHPLDVAWAAGLLYVADTYNNKIKVIDVGRRSCRTIAGTGAPGNADGDGASATFNEPGGIAAGDGVLYVADTNNNVIRVVELKAPYRVRTVELKGVSTPSR